MHMLDRASLDEFSVCFAEQLFGSFSEWEQHAELLTDVQGIPTGALRICIPQPFGKHTLGIQTDDGEITVSFGLWHAHYGAYLGISEEKALAEALEDIHNILEERSIIWVSYHGPAWSGSSLEDANEPFGTSRPGETTVVYSWLGTHDHELQTPV